MPVYYRFISWNDLSSQLFQSAWLATRAFYLWLAQLLWCPLWRQHSLSWPFCCHKNCLLRLFPFRVGLEAGWKHQMIYLHPAWLTTALLDLSPHHCCPLNHSKPSPRTLSLTYALVPLRPRTCHVKTVWLGPSQRPSWLHVCHPVRCSPRSSSLESQCVLWPPYPKSLSSPL